MEKREYTIIDPKEIFGERSILDTNPGETRYFLFEDETPIKASAPKEGGLDIEKYVDGKLEPAINILADVGEGSSLIEISKSKFESLTNL